jgi:hypothetical protein
LKNHRAGDCFSEDKLAAAIIVAANVSKRRAINRKIADNF